MVSVIVPTHQERENVEPLLERLAAVRSSLGEGLEVLVVDKGSDDGTVEVATELLQRYALGRVVQQSARHHGLAQAVVEAAHRASGELIGVMDADLSHPPELLPTLVHVARAGSDVAIASRYVPSGGVPHWPWQRRLLSRVGNVLVRPLVPVTDATSGYFVCRAPLLQSLASDVPGFKILLEILVTGNPRWVQEVPYTFTDRRHGSSKLSWRVLWLYGRQVLRLYTFWLRHPRSRITRGHAPSTPERQRLSVVVITKNEEARITRCLESVRWADELIVVDGLSADRTVELCRASGATVISHPFSGDFGAERNIGNDAASGDWILQLDADDAVSPELRAQIERILREGSPYAAYKFRRKNWFLGHEMRFGGWYHYYPHLFRRGRAHFEGRVHHLLRTDGPMGTLEGALEHRPFDSLHQFVARHNRYTTIEAQELLDEQGALDPRLVRYHLTRRPLKLFWKTYVRKGGFREGWHGLVFSLLFAWVHFLKWARYWELCVNQTAPTSVPLSITTFVERKNEETTAHACLLVEQGTRIHPVTLCSRILWRPVRQWLDAAMTPGRFEEVRGLVRTSLEAWGELLLWCKYWEFTCVKRPVEQHPVAVDRASTVALSSSLTR